MFLTLFLLYNGMFFGFLNLKETIGLSLLPGAVVAFASSFSFLFFFFLFATFCRFVQTLLRPSGIEKL